MAAPLRVANCSGFFGDRLSAAKEMVDGGPIDALTGDWLAELTMLILARTQAKHPGRGFARTFVTQMEQVMGTCLDRNIKVVTNAGGLDPASCAEAVSEVADKLGLSPSIGVVSGDDLRPRLEDLQAAGHDFANLDTGEHLGARASQMLTANAYLGCWGIVDALERGADIVITGRTTDAAVVAGPAAWHHGWQRTDWDALAGAIVAGHVIECGAQATGGNYSFFTEIDNMRHVGFPWAEIAADGTSVIGKHDDGTGGAVTVGTVTSQLLYEIGSPRYLNPDVVSRFDTIELEQSGRDRVRISGTKGEPAPATTKVAMNYVGGFRNSFTFCLTGLDIEAKAAMLEEQLWHEVPGGKGNFDAVHTQLIRTDHADPATNEEATALLRITVKDTDERKVGRPFSSAAIELALASIPGFYGMGGPRGSDAYGVYWPALIPADLVPQYVTVDGQTTVVDPTPPSDAVPITTPDIDLPAPPPDATMVLRPLGTITGARSGDKGGNANLGVFARSADAFAWLDSFLTEDQLRELMPQETAGRAIERHRLPNIWSLNFIVVGLLDEGVAASTRQDPQAKSFGEYLRAKVVPIPLALVP